jgi:hypothetical protein
MTQEFLAFGRWGSMTSVSIAPINLERGAVFPVRAVRHNGARKLHPSGKKFERPVLAPLSAFRPTQMAVGMRAVAAKRKLRRFLEKRPIPAVIGPDDAYYIFDHHHLSLSLWQSDVDQAFVRIVADLSNLTAKRFLARMSDCGLLHAFDGKGRRICPSRLPKSLGELKCDRYRDLAWSVREAGGYAKTAAPYAEFQWANYFRERILKATVRRDFDAAHDTAMRLARLPLARNLPGFISGR